MGQKKTKTNPGDNKIKDKGTVYQRMKMSNRETEEDTPTLTKSVI